MPSSYFSVFEILDLDRDNELACGATFATEVVNMLASLLFDQARFFSFAALACLVLLPRFFLFANFTFNETIADVEAHADRPRLYREGEIRKYLPPTRRPRFETPGVRLTRAMMTADPGIDRRPYRGVSHTR